MKSAFTPEELHRLFNGPECAAFAADPARRGRYWLPLIGLYSGARVNEVCQMNPQCDIKQDAKTGIWSFLFSATTPGDPRIKKSVKVADLAIPIHSKLLELGFLDYLAQVKAQGAALLFPEWLPVNKKASKVAEEWFREHLVTLGLRDETPKAKIVGFHAFRSTFAARGEEIGELRWGAITGHRRLDESKVAKNYRGMTPLQIQQQILERFSFDIAPPAPA